MNVSTLIDKITGSFDDKRRWREYKARAAELPEPHRTALGAVERYLTYYGAITKGDLLVSMLEDLADLFEQAATDGTSVRAIVGDDPVGFAEDFIRNYADGQWINKERTRLTDAIDAIDAIDQPQEGDSR